MLLDLEDVEIRASIRQTTRHTIRLVLDYPNTEQHRTKVMTALSDLMRPDLASVLSAQIPDPQEEGHD